ncbi:MAG TPA: hypothetical protein VK501_20290 [Baekduia sp.]|uniref:hypothetical protein n=1 Tax=Baekduia sp. TaxID=2600305 RepID=UPI002BB007B0|nr:hypothetical protein [Baekduia sp.]HMJ36252.1 hypothetical protein [Baekduia sp.]
MTPKLLPSLTALTLLATLAPAGAATATAQSDAPTTVSSIEIVKAYAYKDTRIQPGKTYAKVVFKTKGELPRRFDGMIRAGGALDDTGHSVSSIRGKHGKAAHCYAILAEIKDGKIAGLKGKSGKLGTRHTLVVTARGTDGDVTDSIGVTLRKQRAGDASGKPLGC